MGKQSDELARALHRVLIEEARERKEPEWHPTLAELESYCQGELPAKLKERLLDHFILCERCSDLLLVFRDSPDLERLFQPTQDDLIASETESEVKGFWQDFVEKDLAQKIRESLPPDLEVRYKILTSKRDSENLTPAEYEELLGLSDQIERLEVQRLEALVRLSKIREVPFETLIEELGLQPDSHG